MRRGKKTSTLLLQRWWWYIHYASQLRSSGGMYGISSTEKL